MTVVFFRPSSSSSSSRYHPPHLPHKHDTSTSTSTSTTSTSTPPTIVLLRHIVVAFLLRHSPYLIGFSVGVGMVHTAWWWWSGGVVLPVIPITTTTVTLSRTSTTTGRVVVPTTPHRIRRRHPDTSHRYHPNIGTVWSLRDIPHITSKSHVGISKQSLYTTTTTATTTATTPPPPLLPTFPDNIIGISMATIHPGQTISKHIHPTMMEIFFVYEGEVDITLYSNQNQNQNQNQNHQNQNQNQNHQNELDHLDDHHQEYHDDTTTTTCADECWYVAVPNVAHSLTVRYDAPMDTKMMVWQLAVEEDEEDDENDDVVDPHSNTTITTATSTSTTNTTTTVVDP